MDGTTIAAVGTGVNIVGFIAVAAYNRGVIKATVNGLIKSVVETNTRLGNVERKIDNHISAAAERRGR